LSNSRKTILTITEFRIIIVPMNAFLSHNSNHHIP
jgi:hypothetical protein